MYTHSHTCTQTHTTTLDTPGTYYEPLQKYLLGHLEVQLFPSSLIFRFSRFPYLMGSQFSHLIFFQKRGEPRHFVDIFNTCFPHLHVSLSSFAVFKDFTHVFWRIILLKHVLHENSFFTWVSSPYKCEHKAFVQELTIVVKRTAVDFNFNSTTSCLL